MADGFHIDGDGNLWIGSASTNFDNNAAFYVKTDGEMKATSGEIGGLDIESNRIKSNSYSNTNEEGFQIHSDGTAKFYGSLTANTLSATGANISGNITATDGTIGGTQINSSNIQSTTFDDNTGYQIGANSATFHDVTITGTLDGANIDGTVSGTLATANSGQRIEFSNNGSAIMQFYSNSGQSGYVADVSGDLHLQAQANSALVLSGGTNGIKSFGPWYYWDGSAYTTGNSGKVIISDSNGNPSWGNVPANAGVTSIVTTPGNHITASNNTGTVNLVVNASNLNDTHNHTTTNAAGTTFSGDNHGNNHGVDMSNVQNSSANGGGTYHSHTTSAVNALATAASSVLNLSANTGSILINHLDNDHANFANSGHGHNYANSGHGHDYAANSHGHDYAANSHGHGSSYLSNSHEIGHPTNHNHPYSSSGHGHGNTYANLTHVHINPLTHDARLLNINANTVPGINVVNRLNPITANFSADYLERAKEKQGAVNELDGVTYRLTQQDVKQALTDEGLDPSTIAMIIEDVTYAKNDKPGLDEDEPMKGLMDGEIDAILVQAIKDLSAKIDLLEDRISTLEG